MLMKANNLQLLTGLAQFEFEKYNTTKSVYLSSLHFLSPPPESHIWIIVSGAISFFLFDLRDEGRPSAILTLSYPVVIDSLNKIIILI